MSYLHLPEVDETGAPSEDSVQEFLRDLGARKEFRSLLPASSAAEADNTPNPYGFGLPAGPAAPEIPMIAGLRLHGAQAFVRGFSSPDTPYTRLLLNWQTGTGKTIGMLSIAQEYVRLYRAQSTVPPASRPTVFVIGFTKSIILAEMLRHPEFGFVSPAEAVELQRLHVLAEASGGAATPDFRHYSSLVGVFKRRITDRTRGGYYQFYGYKEFANRLFVDTRKGRARGFSVANLYAHAKPARRQADEEELDDPPAEEDGPSFLERIDAAVAAGDVEVNRELLDSLRGGLIIADEIHNTYNLRAKNSYGVAIQYALEKTSADDPKVAPRAVFMSATATGGVATEIVDLLNFLVPVEYLPGKRRLHHSEFFRTVEGAGGRRSTTLLPGALERIGRLSAGRVSFLLDSNEASYPRRIFVGAPLADPLRPGQTIAYLQFTPCPMAPFHEKTLAHMLAGAPEAERVAIPANAYTLYDMAYPNPDFEPGAARGAADTPAYGLYLSSETSAKLAAAPSEWKAAAGVAVDFSGGGARTPPLITGPFLDLAPAPRGPPGVGAYSTKFQTLGTDLLGIVRSGPGKIMIYHHRVRMSGVLQIQGLLEMNGFLNETAVASPSTICAICGVAKRVHGDGPAGPRAPGGGPPHHEFTPARYVLITSEIDRSVLDRSIARYNAQTNAEGYEFRVLVGSKIIREGFDLKAVRHQLIASLPTDIPTLLQVFGRVVRKGSHSGLPVEQQDVRIRIYVSTVGMLAGPEPEVVRYAEKMEAYLLIQEVEKALRRYAVDAFVNYGRMAAAGLLEKAAIDAVPYRPAVDPSEILRGPQTMATFYAYGHGDREVETLKAAIQALFSTRPVWTYEDLWAAVRSGRVVGVAQNPASFSEESFALALDALARHAPAVVYESVLVGNQTREAGMGEVALISRVGDYYIRTPAGPGGQPVLDIESYVRDNTVLCPLRVRVADYLQTTAHRSFDFAIRLKAFEREFATPEDAGGPRIEEAFMRYGAEFHYALLQAIVEGAAGGEGTAAEVWRKAGVARTPFARAVELYTRFKVLVRGIDIAAEADAARLARKLPQDKKAPLGYIRETAVRLYAAEENEKFERWYDIPRKALRVGTRFLENDIVVGYIESQRGGLRFKIRPPLHVLSAANVRDARSLARGAVCETRPRAEQEDLIHRLQAEVVNKRRPRTAHGLAGLNTADLCAAIRAQLLAREEAVRNQPGGMFDGLRWFYLFNERLPSVTLGR